MKATHLFKHPLRVGDASGLLPALPPAQKKTLDMLIFVFLLCFFYAFLFSSSFGLAPCKEKEKTRHAAASSLLPSLPPSPSSGRI